VKAFSPFSAIAEVLFTKFVMFTVSIAKFLDAQEAENSRRALQTFPRVKKNFI
jgi:hypothetical protein